MGWFLQVFQKPFTQLSVAQQGLVAALVLVCALLVLFSITFAAKRVKGGRFHARRGLASAVELSWRDDAGFKQHDGRCRDISERGLGVEMPDPIMVDTPVSFRVLAANLTGTGLVRHCTPIGAAWVVGVKVRKISRMAASSQV